MNTACHNTLVGLSRKLCVADKVTWNTQEIGVVLSESFI